ncbi:hypothetical protein FNV43_RR10496 [Rhamnella rubrinervis]|uniref:Uncharacterized protein n=1 Tax=Rhamnella rubrinervis TaxID=2594499 RepID=A0A8K0H4F5_9ROSA|nr:hypothetical protein FNV43_RR10496 [Rhamnella rubrinervis]
MGLQDLEPDCCLRKEEIILSAKGANVGAEVFFPFRRWGSNAKALDSEVLPSLKLQTDKQVYRPGDPVIVTIEITNPAGNANTLCHFWSNGSVLRSKALRSWIRSGENVFVECSTPALVMNQIVSAGTTKSYVVRTLLPSVLPPSYKGATIRYLYYARSTMSGQWLILENAHSRGESVKNLSELEARIPLHVWITQKNNGLLMEESQNDGIVPATTIQMDIFWKETDGDSIGRERTSLSSTLALPRLSVAEVLYDAGADYLCKQIFHRQLVSPSQQQKLTKQLSAGDDGGASSSPAVGAVEPLASEGFIRGRSYNIRMDDHIGGTLTFLHGEGSRRCLEVQSDHNEVVADLVQTSFLFPFHGWPYVFSTSHVSVQWALRFEFFTTLRNVDWTRYEHPLLMEGRDRSEWVLPITVHAPPPGTSAPHSEVRSLSPWNPCGFVLEGTATVYTLKNLLKLMWLYVELKMMAYLCDVVTRIHEFEIFNGLYNSSSSSLES